MISGSFSSGACLVLVVKAVAEQLFDGYHGDIVVYRAAEVQTGDFSVLGDEGHALLDDVLRRMDLDLLALDEDLAGG